MANNKDQNKNGDKFKQDSKVKKEKYSKPQLTSYGHITDITSGSKGGAKSDPSNAKTKSGSG